MPASIRIGAVLTGETSALVSNQIEAQIERLWMVRGVIETVCKALDQDAEAAETTDQPAWWALKSAAEMIQDINAKLEQAQANCCG